MSAGWQACDYGRSPVVLESALDKLRVFWIYVSIVLIVAFGFILCFALWYWAIAESMPAGM